MSNADSYHDMSEKTSKPLILLLAGSAQNARSINRLLEKLFEIVTVDEAESAWSGLLEQSNVSLVISELVLVNNEFGLLERIREAGSTRLAATPVLLLIGEQDGDNLRDRAIELGATDFINSPFSSAELLTRSRLHVDLHVQQTRDNANEIQQSGATSLLHQLSQEKFFHSRVQQELSFSQRHSSNFSLSKLKVDNMKAVVASFDKATAMAVIQAVANIIQKTLRFEDSLCYFGSAEFCILYPATNGIGATTGINRILQKIAQRKIKVAGKLIPITLSGAVFSCIPDDGVELATVFEKVDSGVQRAISNGGNQILSATPAGGKQQISLDRALRLIEADKAEDLKNHARSLLLAALPLLEFAELNLPIEPNSKSIREQLGAMK